MKRRKGWRKIVVDDIEYQWKFGSWIVVKNEDVTYKFPLTDITGMTWDVIEKGMYKRWLSITPSQVADAIKGQVNGEL